MKEIARRSNNRGRVAQIAGSRGAERSTRALLSPSTVERARPLKRNRATRFCYSIFAFGGASTPGRPLAARGVSRKCPTANIALDVQVRRPGERAPACDITRAIEREGISRESAG